MQVAQIKEPKIEYPTILPVKRTEARQVITASKTKFSVFFQSLFLDLKKKGGRRSMSALQRNKTESRDSNSFHKCQRQIRIS